MIPFDSFLLDPPMLFGSGYLSAKLFGRRPAVLRVVEAATIAIFWGTSISLYLNKEWTRWIWELCRAESGRDWMLNSGVFSFDHRNVSRRTHIIAAAILATYPLWLELGVRTGSERS